METVNFFCWKVPVCGVGQTVEIGEDKYKFWRLVGDRDVSFRTKIKEDGTYDIQERLDNYLWKGDSNGGLGILRLDRIEPESNEGINSWLQSHLWLKEVRNGLF